MTIFHWVKVTTVASTNFIEPHSPTCFWVVRLRLVSTWVWSSTKFCVCRSLEKLLNAKRRAGSHSFEEPALCPKRNMTKSFFRVLYPLRATRKAPTRMLPRLKLGVQFPASLTENVSELEPSKLPTNLLQVHRKNSPGWSQVNAFSKTSWGSLHD